MSVNKKRTFSQQGAEQFINQVLAVEKEEHTIRSEKRMMYALNSSDKEPVVKAVSAEPVSNTIVVLRLPLSVTRVDLYQYFASYGVVRNVDGPVNPRFKAAYCFAFVTFQTADQAAHAFRDLSESHTMNGYRVNVGWAKNKEPAENPAENPAEKPAEKPDEKPDEKPAENPAEKPEISVSAEPVSNMIRLNQLPARSLNPSHLMEYFRPYGIVQKLSWKTKKVPNKDNAVHYSSDAYLTFETSTQAADAVRALSESDGKLYGYQVTATFIKKGPDANELSAKSKRANILLVKDLPCHSFTPSELNEYLAPYGTVQKLHWPTTDGGFRDYAFIKYETADQATHAFQILSESDRILCGQKVTFHFVKECNIPPRLLSYLLS